MQKYLLKICAMVLFAFILPAYGQSEREFNIYGYYSTRFSAWSPNDETQAKNSFGIQSFNLLLSTSFADHYKAFANLEFRNNFDTEMGWGSLSLFEVWLEYQYSDAFKIKAGQFVVPFNAFNLIHNRPPLFWYISRPIVYEEADYPSLGGVVPETGNLMVSGTLGDGVKFDYNVYLGNTGRTTNEGIDLNASKLVGARVGLRTHHLTLGVSSTVDKGVEKDETEVVISQFDRTRYGADARYTMGNVTVEGEYIGVREGATASRPVVTKSFYYVALGYDFESGFTPFISYDYYKDPEDARFRDGLRKFRPGVNYRPNDQVTLKAEVNFHRSPVDTYRSYESYQIAIAVLL